MVDVPEGDTCKQSFSHLNPITLRRLSELPELMDMLPFDPEFPFGTIYLHKFHTSTLQYDTVCKQSMDDVINKIRKLGAETTQMRVERYMDHGQIWARQLSALAGDTTWNQLYRKQKLDLADIRGELLHFASAEEALAPLGVGLGRSDAMRWNIPKLSSKILIEKTLAVYENRRELREDQMYAVPVTKVM